MKKGHSIYSKRLKLGRVIFWCFEDFGFLKFWCLKRGQDHFLSENVAVMKSSVGGTFGVFKFCIFLCTRSTNQW